MTETKFDAWLADDGPAGVVIREPLRPMEGTDGVFFPATYAATEDKSKFAGGYNIDTFPDGSNVCLVDSVGSQANRIEPVFARGETAKLVPQVVVVAGNKRVSLLEDAGHRAGDALIRNSGLNADIVAAFQEAQRGNALPLAKLAPTSLVFGVWDSRGTQVKSPRLVSATIRAFNVHELTRSANYLPQMRFDFINENQLPEPASKAEKDKYSEWGYLNALATKSHGGVMLRPGSGKVIRDISLSLAALRLLAVREPDGTTSIDATKALRRYILGLSLVAVTATATTYLRQGCNLVVDASNPAKAELVYANGKTEPFTMSAEEAFAYAHAAATAFEVGPNREVPFDPTRARQELGLEVEAADPATSVTAATPRGRGRGRGRTAEG